jgi:hypothetical protein
MFDLAGPLLRNLGGIPSTRIEDKNGGAVKRITETLDEHEKFLFLICPKGTIIKKPWRSGYYHIGNKTKANFRVTGLDYVEKKVIVSQSYHYNDSPENIEKSLKIELSKIVPLYPEGEVVDIKIHDSKKRHLVDKKWLCFIFIVTALLMISMYMNGFFATLKHLFIIFVIVNGGIVIAREYGK